MAAYEGQQGRDPFRRQVPTNTANEEEEQQRRLLPPAPNTAAQFAPPQVGAGRRGVADAITEAGRGISGALMGSAFESFGKAFDGGGYTPIGQTPDTSYMDNWRQMGEKTKKALENRWFMSEFRRFREGMLKSYEGDVNGIIDNTKGVLQKLQEGMVPGAEDGSWEPIDLSVPENQIKVLRLQNTVQAEVFNQLANRQIQLNNDAAENYWNNPIVSDYLQKIMLKQNEMLMGQFSQPEAAAQALTESEIGKNKAQQGYYESATAKQTAAAKTDYKNIDAIWQDVPRSQFIKYVQNDPLASQLIDEAPGFTGIFENFVQAERKAYRQNKKLTDAQVAADPALQKMEDDHIASMGLRLRERSLGEWVNKTYGPEALREATTDPSTHGALADPELPFNYDVKTQISKDKMDEKAKDWEALAAKIGNMELAKDPSKDPDELVDELINEWFPLALQGKNKYEDNSYMREFRGLTADPKNEAARPYIEYVRQRLENYLRYHLGRGEKDLGPKQYKAPRRPGRGGTGAMGLVGHNILSGLFPEDIVAPFPETYEERFADVIKAEQEEAKRNQVQ